MKIISDLVVFFCGYKPDVETWHPVPGVGHGMLWHS